MSSTGERGGGCRGVGPACTESCGVLERLKGGKGEGRLQRSLVPLFAAGPPSTVRSTPPRPAPQGSARQGPGPGTGSGGRHAAADAAGQRLLPFHFPALRACQVRADRHAAPEEHACGGVGPGQPGRGRRQQPAVQRRRQTVRRRKGPRWRGVGCVQVFEVGIPYPGLAPRTRRAARLACTRRTWRSPPSTLP